MGFRRTLLTAAAVTLALMPSAGWTRRVSEQPSALRHVRADAIVLVQVTEVTPRGKADVDSWKATARIVARLSGEGPKGTYHLEGDGLSQPVPMDRPKRGGYYVVYLSRGATGFDLVRGDPFWYARRSGDPRLSGLDRALPLGPVRSPTRKEEAMLDLIQPRVRDALHISDLSHFTQIYSRSGASTVGALVFRSKHPRRFMVDTSEEFPTEDSCRCRLTFGWIEVGDLWEAGRLPPFDP